MAREFPENAMTLWVRIKLSSPDGVGRAGANGPELDAGSDNARGMQVKLVDFTGYEHASIYGKVT